MKASAPATTGTDYMKINDYIREFLKFNDYTSTFECLDAEQRTKVVTSKTAQVNKVPASQKQMDTFPRLYRFFDKDAVKFGAESVLDNLLGIHSLMARDEKDTFSREVELDYEDREIGVLASSGGKYDVEPPKDALSVLSDWADGVPGGHRDW